MLTVGSLCSGACDGMALGLEWAGIGPVLWQVEIDADRRKNLARHWPNADRSVHDVRFAGAGTLNRVDLITATFPCTDVSSAGARAGLAGARSGLWFECLRCITELRPAWVVVENVASGARNWVPHVREGLERLGYACLPVPVAASDCGAPHDRRRVFVVAHADWCGEPARPEHAEVAGASTHVGDVGGESVRREPTHAEQEEPETRAGSESRAHAGWPTELEVVPSLHGVPGRVVSELGDSVVPQCAEVVGWVIRELLDAERSRYLAEKRAVEGPVCAKGVR